MLGGTYLLMDGKMQLCVFLVKPLVRKFWLYFGLPSAHLDRTLPWPVYAIVSVLVVTFTDYWAHRGMHQIPGLWHIHKIHHSARNLNWTSIYHKHFLELLLNQPLRLITLLALGTELEPPFGIIFIVIDVLGNGIYDWISVVSSYLISTPQAQRIHHSLDPGQYDTNFGNTLMIRDRIFESISYDPNSIPPASGVAEEIYLSFWKQQVMPLVWIAKDASAALSNRLKLGVPTEVTSFEGRPRVTEE